MTSCLSELRCFFGKMKTFFPFVALLFLLGCVGPGARPKDQLASLQKYADTKINRPVALSTESLPKLLQPSLYLKLHSASILNAPRNQSQTGSMPEFEEVKGEEGGKGFKISWGGEDLSRPVGSATAIASDGYFLTAYHVVRNEAPWVWVEEVTVKGSKDGEHQIHATHKVAPARIVFYDRKGDFAIIKAPYRVRYYLALRETKLKENELLFGGGPWHETGAGFYLSETHESSKDPSIPHGFRRIETSVPAIPGDSGSALVDEDGLLCGIMVRGVKGLFYRIWPSSFASMTDSSAIMSIIEKDRRANKPHS